MRSRFAGGNIEYNGSQLRSHFIFENFSLQGDAIAAFTGPCSVAAHMVDLEDLAGKEFIYSENMLHFIAEHFDRDLEAAVLRKRLLVSLIGEAVNRRKNKYVLERRANGLYCRGKKFNVAVATLSPVSALIHVGVNISARGAPVPIISLNDLRLGPKKFALEVMRMYCTEMDSADRSKTKVKAVK